MGADLVTCVLYTKALARFPLRYLGFLVWSVGRLVGRERLINVTVPSVPRM